MARCRLLGMSFALAITGASALTAGSGDPDWPCVQRKIPELSAGMMWAGPPLDENAKALSQDDGNIRTLAARLAARRTTLEEAAKLIKSFAATQEADVRTQKLTGLFAAVFASINSERRQIMNGIVKYARKQKVLAGTVRQIRVEFSDALKTKTKTEAGRKKRRELEQKLSWQSRIYEERAQSLRYVCESPVILEQRAFAIGREIAGHIEQ